VLLFLRRIRGGWGGGWDVPQQITELSGFRFLEHLFWQLLYVSDKDPPVVVARAREEAVRRDGVRRERHSHTRAHSPYSGRDTRVVGG
jgi:hypothetical protein